MLFNYWKIALRNILRNKAYSLITVSGLAVGIACCLLLMLFILDEHRYDKHHQSLDNLYRITSTFQGATGIDKLATASPPIAPTLQHELPEIEVATRVVNPPGVAQYLFQYEDKIFYETNGFLADSTVFSVLTYQFIEGDAATALRDANTMVIAESLARKLFGSESGLNKLIKVGQGGEPALYKITGVFQDQPQSHLQATFFLSMMSPGLGEYLRSDNAMGEWAGQNFVPSYIKLVDGANIEEVIKKMNDVLIQYGTEDMKALGMTKTLGLEPVKDIYLKSDIGRSPRITYVYVIASIAAFILIIACINFMNLATAKATRRATEIGVRKVVGAYRSSLIAQLMGEAMAIVVIAIALSLIITQAALPLFNELTNKHIGLGGVAWRYTVGSLLAIALSAGFLSGSYPALYLSSFKPAAVLKGKNNLGNASGFLRQSLVVFQFIIAISLVCSMFIINKQLEFIQNKNLGFNPSAKIVLPLRTERAKTNYEALRDELIRNKIASEVSAADYLPGNIVWSDMMFYTQGGNMNTAVLNRRNRVDAGYIEMLRITMVAGRTFTTNREMDGDTKVIINETSAKRFGKSPEQMVGEKIYFDWQGENYAFEVIGVMADYHQNSLKEAINPLMFSLPKDTGNYGYLIATVDAGNFTEAIPKLEALWKSVVSDTPFEYSFLDETIRKQYDDDKKVSSIINSFTFIAMIISCLGLYGLSTYMAERRFKEIGIRKVFGAGVAQIVGLLSTEFVRLVVIAFVIAVPLSWYAMNRWLEGFAYKTGINGWVFLMAGLTALGIALLTVSYESVKAATTNPVNALRNE
ncbi:MAG: ABC transporter permease [Flammeovirgaceae bacterium]|nr:MAG: ABC transporter permease [Flammeovirgaceae bacterium]